MVAKLDLTGQRFGRLVALQDSGERRTKRTMWHCRCDCGTVSLVSVSNLRGGGTQSCGCLGRERASKRRLKHGHTKGNHISKKNISSAYVSWTAMKSRCSRKVAHNYKYYGGRGITVCDRWRDSFENFLADMGPRPPKHSLDRINNDGNYEPGNCRWASDIVQKRNKRSVALVEYDGRSRHIADWAVEIGISHEILYRRLRMGWSVARAFTQPPRIRAAYARITEAFEAREAAFKQPEMAV